jgi:hypothetical protein
MKYLLIIKKMKITVKKTFYLFIFLIALNACQSVKDGLTNKKRTNSDEFLVEKKSPLALPPEFNELPEPKTLIKKNSEVDDGIDLKEILSKKGATTNTVSLGKNSNGSLEKNILEKIKKD